MRFLSIEKNPLNQVNEFTSVSKEFKDNLEDGIFFSKEQFLNLNLEKKTQK